MSTSEPDGDVGFQSVYDFCGQDKEIYLEILEEIKLSVQNLKSSINTISNYNLDDLLFIRHKMKSTFRILQDEEFRILLDDFVEAVEKQDTIKTEELKIGLEKIGTEYENKLSAELA